MSAKMLYFCSPIHDAGWSSPVARWAHNPKVGGSNPPPATKGGQRASFFYFIFVSAAISTSLVSLSVMNATI